MTPPPDDLSGFSMLDLFKAEVETHAATLEQGLVDLEAAPTDVARIEPLMRAAHSLKGAARIVGLDGVVGLAHGMEELLVKAQDGGFVLGAGAIDLLLAGTDVLRKTGELKEGETDAFFAEQKDAIESIIQHLRLAESGQLGDAAPAAPAPVAQAPAAEEPAAPEPEAASPATPEPPREPPPPPQATPSSRTPASAVRIDPEVFTRMLAYAGESVVQARRLAEHTDALDGLRRAVERLDGRLAAARDRFRRDGIALPEPDPFESLRREAEGTLARIAGRTAAFDEASRHAADLAGRMYRQVLTSRMRPFSEGVTHFPRMVRDLARELGKMIRFEIEGRDVPVDRDILERLDAPLGHMLRNACDHGLELPQEREAQDKYATGTLRLEARHRAGMLEIRVEDDGRGRDPEQLRERIVDRGMISADIARDLSESELMEFLFLPGFSTRKEVTQISGRGVGLDVVHTMVREAGGTVRAELRATGGLRFILVLPITRSVIRVAVLQVAGEPFAFPLTQIESLVRVEAEEIRAIENRQSFELDGREIGLVPAADVLGLKGRRKPADVLYVVIVRSGDSEYGLAIDGYLGEQSLVVRTLDARLGDVANVSAVALDSEGHPLVIVDVQDLVRSVDTLLHEGRLRTIRATSHMAADGRRKRKRVLVVDDSITVREVERKLLASRGYDVDVCVDGADAWNTLRAQEYDLVLSDVDMPRMNGIELVRRIREDARLRSMPVMIVSYKESEEDRMRGLEAGANAYLTKSSFHDETLVSEVVDLIGEPMAGDDE
ncbi:MAG: hybrid sensor histidine kinase/response regulator [Planctomycetota bacterium]|nr:hybrid sensor histidine kinase/response regulator [Planctomycetota bacterium]